MLYFLSTDPLEFLNAEKPSTPSQIYSTKASSGIQVKPQKLTGKRPQSKQADIYAASGQKKMQKLIFHASLHD